jgi:Transposase DDE domain group 1
VEHPAGESDDGCLRVDFDRRLKLEFHGSRITSDAGLLAFRELDDALGLTDLAGAALSECRRGKNTRYMLTGLFRQSVFGRLAGYEDVNDADRLAHDPAMRAVVDRNGLDRAAASTSQMGRFETEWLTGDANLAALADLSGTWIDQVHACKPQTTIVLDMDSSVSETHGAQEGSAYNGHFGCTCYHPLFVFNQFGDLERCALRAGNVHSADGWRDVLEPVVARYRRKMKRRYFRGDAAFANPEVYELLEVEGYKYTIRLPANSVLQERIGWLLKRPVGRPPHEVRRYYASFRYQAGSWTKPRRVVAKVEWHPGELYPRVGFIVTNMTRPAERVVAFYNHRGTAEQWIKEGKNAVTWTKLSCHNFKANAVRLQLHALAYNLANFLRTLALPEEAARPVGEDRRQDCPPRPLRDFPDGRDGAAARSVPGDSECDRRAPSVATCPMLRITVSPLAGASVGGRRAPKSGAVDRRTRHFWPSPHRSREVAGPWPTKSL